MTRARELSRLGNIDILSIDSSYNVGIGSTIPDAKLDVAGIVSATSFYGNASNLSGIVAGSTLSPGSGAQRVVVTSQTSGTMTAAATNADLSWDSSTNTLSATTLSGNITGTAATFTGNVSIGGTVTSEDVTNVDSVGVITSRDGIRVGASQSISPVSGTITYYGDGSNLDGIEAGVVNFVASGTLANGTPVIIKDDGTVGIVTGANATMSGGTPAVFESSTVAYSVSAAYDSANDKVVIVYEDEGNNGYGTAVVGTVSGTSISFGTPVVFESNTGPAITSIVATFDSSANRVVIAYRNWGIDYHGKAIVGTVSGTSISFGSIATFESAAVAECAICCDTTNNKVVIAYSDYGNSQYGTAVVGTVSGTSISFGSPTVFESSSTDSIGIVHDWKSGKTIISYRNGGASPYAGKAVVGTVSSTSISFGTAVVFEDSWTTSTSPVHDTTNNKIVIAYKNQGDSNKGKVVIGTVSGTSISFTTPVIFESGSSNYVSAVYDSSAKKVVIVYVKDNWFGTALIATVSGNTISFGAPFSWDTSIAYISAIYDPDNQKTVSAYQDSGNSSYGTAVVLTPVDASTNLTTDNYIGITGEAIVNAATGKVNVVGGVNSGQSGLTTNRKYYVSQINGALTTTAGTPSVVAGTSISDTEILVWKS